MWLDRFSGHSTPSGTPPYNRSYSPSQRGRPTHLSPGTQPTRPGFSPRSSSLSLAVTPNDSTTSLPGTLRSNGSTLKQARSISPAQDVADPLVVLNGIIGKPGEAERIQVPSEKQSTVQKPDQLVESIDFGDLSLEGFLQNGENNHIKSDAGIQETDQCSLSCRRESIRVVLLIFCIAEKERDKFQELHNAITVCPLQSLLLVYLADTQVSHRAVMMSSNLSNRTSQVSSQSLVLSPPRLKPCNLVQCS